EYGTSRTPLREALKVLAAEGLVTMKLRRGAYVTEVSQRDLSEVFHLLSLLECDAVGVVAERASEAQLADLVALHDQLEKAVTDAD
ncbi:GntR family transcriptional regulator, partial [Bacillus cereus group sp. BC325]|uniref:GntR family transcriptional regulator n=1 Tax=Bacillus cereus group sp. BC325 TaxID=3445311 RepID=UPI003F238D54